jgi:hypothetical protein
VDNFEFFLKNHLESNKNKKKNISTVAQRAEDRPQLIGFIFHLL